MKLRKKGKVTVRELLTKSSVSEILEEVSKNSDRIEELICIWTTKDQVAYEASIMLDSRLLFLLEYPKTLILQSNWGDSKDDE